MLTTVQNTVHHSPVGLLHFRPAACFAPLGQFAGDECSCSFRLAVFGHAGQSSRCCGVGARGLPGHRRRGLTHHCWLDLISSFDGIVQGRRRRLLVGAAIRLKKLEPGLESLGCRGGGARSRGGRGGGCHCFICRPGGSGVEWNQQPSSSHGGETFSLRQKKIIFTCCEQ